MEIWLLLSVSKRYCFKVLKINLTNGNLQFCAKNINHIAPFTVEQWFCCQFQGTGLILNKKRRQTSDINWNWILDKLREVTSATVASCESARKVLKLHKSHPYKIQHHQKFTEDDLDFFYLEQNIVKGCSVEGQLTRRIARVNVSVNWHNCRYCIDDKPYISKEGRTKIPNSLMLTFWDSW